MDHSKRQEKLRRRVVKSGKKKIRKADHPLTKDELLESKVQTASPLSRIAISVGGLILMAEAWFSFFESSLLLRILCGIFGLILFFGGIIGIRKTLSKVIDSLDSIDIGDILESIFD